MVMYKILERNDNIAIMKMYKSNMFNDIIISVNGIDIVRLTNCGMLSHIVHEKDSKEYNELLKLGFNLVKDRYLTGYGVKYND